MSPTPTSVQGADDAELNLRRQFERQWQDLHHKEGGTNLQLMFKDRALELWRRALKRGRQAALEVKSEARPRAPQLEKRMKQLQQALQELKVLPILLDDSEAQAIIQKGLRSTRSPR
jgi:hypothetical protein